MFERKNQEEKSQINFFQKVRARATGGNLFGVLPKGVEKDFFKLIRVRTGNKSPLKYEQNAKKITNLQNIVLSKKLQDI